MMGLLSFLLPPLVAALLVVAIHVYFGLHVIRREIIFVDLSLAQIAALGATLAFVLGIHPEEPLSYVFSLSFVILGGLFFALTRAREQRIPQEAIIGIAYAVATAMAILVADRAPGGAEHIKETLSGTILWVRWVTIGQMAALYLVVGLLHGIFRRRFFALTEKYRSGELGRADRGWDFLFYLTFGLTIVLSVRVAGILLVFSFLLVPTSAALLLAGSWRSQLLLGWGIGLAAAVGGLCLSYAWDLPSGPAIVALLAFVLSLTAVFRAFSTKKRSALVARD
ncbi:MAG: metal ABC transporter permease [candidate division KSB1 bacterium]|nr:metal ABC transporter permease [candidate division KSB1 bacterium]